VHRRYHFRINKKVLDRARITWYDSITKGENMKSTKYAIELDLSEIPTCDNWSRVDETYFSMAAAEDIVRMDLSKYPNTPCRIIEIKCEETIVKEYNTPNLKNK
jgi:hypothetical protein